MSEESGRDSGRPAQGWAALGGETFDAGAAVGGWRGICESVAPTLVFVAITAVAPGRLAVALGVSLAVSAVAMVARLTQRQSLTQVIGGALLALISAGWAWRSGEAKNFYATGLLINAVWLVGCLASLAARWPLVGLFVGAWQAASGEESWTGWRTGTGRRRLAAATWLLAGMFALRLGVELPLYFAPGASDSLLGIARLILGVPLFALTLWFIWLLIRPLVATARSREGEGRGEGMADGDPSGN